MDEEDGQWPPLSLAKLAAFLFAFLIRVIHDFQITPSKRRDCEQARAVGRRVA
jgi:hypothetical protein